MDSHAKKESGKPPSASCAPSLSPDTAFRILINLDITGSMSNELEGVKAMLTEFVTILGDLAVPLSIAIVTFTESSSGCFVSLAEFNDPSEAMRYVKSIKLCQPPDRPNINASGDDGPENQKAALHRLVDLEPIPTIGFLITDAEPHLGLAGGPRRLHGSTIAQELSWLESRGVPYHVAQDFYRVFSLVLDHFGDALVMNCIIYSTSLKELNVYGRVASMTGGMLMHPHIRTSKVLAKGMLDVVNKLLSQLPGEGDIQGAQQLEGFELYDISQMGHCLSEQDGNMDSRIQVGDNETIFKIAMDRTVAVCGRKWGKRSVGMSAATEQLQFVWRTARYLMHSSLGNCSPDSLDADLAAIYALRDDLASKLPKEVQGHLTIKETDFDMIASVATSSQAVISHAGSESSPVSIISLETVGEALQEDAEWDDWLATVMRLLFGFPLDVQLPLDRNGQPDFADAWASVATRVGCDRMSCAEFMQLLGGSPKARGPTDGHEYNTFLALADPRDTLGSMVFKIASGTQVLNFITGVLMGAKGFLPSLHVGMASSCLLKLVSEMTGSSFRMTQAQQIVHSLRIMHTAPARSLTHSMLKEGHANPADPISKLLAVAVRVTGSGAMGHMGAVVPAQQDTQHNKLQKLQRSVLALLLEEWIGAAVQEHYGKRTPENNRAYFKSLLAYLPIKLLLPQAAEKMDPLKQLHLLELAELGEEYLGEGWEEAWWARLERGMPQSGLPPHPVLAHFKSCALRLLQLLSPDPVLGSGDVTLPDPVLGSDGVTLPDPVLGVDSITLPGTQLDPDGITPPGAALGSDGNTPQGTVLESDGITLPAPVLGSDGITPPGAADKSDAIAAVWPEWRRGVLRALLHRQRSERYRCLGPLSEDSTELKWERVEDESLSSLAVALMRKVFKEQVDGFRKQREEYARKELLEAAASALLKYDGDEAAAAKALSTLSIRLGDSREKGSREVAERPVDGPPGPHAQLLNVTVYLDRSDVPHILDFCSDASISSPALHALVRGSWSTIPPQALRRNPIIKELCSHHPDLLALLSSEAECRRQLGHNRHGHSMELQYPGPCGWSEEYGSERIVRVPSRKGYVMQMQRFTSMSSWARCSVRDGRLAGRVEEALTRYHDANLLPKVQAQLESILGVRMPT